MNTSSIEFKAPAYGYERTILDRAEFARVIRKHRSVRACVFVHQHDQHHVVPECGSVCYGIDIPAKQAIAQLNRCDFDLFGWEVDEFGPHVSIHVAPEWVQMTRRRDFVAERIPHHEARLALPERGDRLDALMREMTVRKLASDRAEVERWNAQLAARRQQPAAA